jgi:hypothetical protein
MQPRKDLANGRRDAGRLRTGRAAVGGKPRQANEMNFSSAFLPYTGESIEFLLEEREQPIHGTFAKHDIWARSSVVLMRAR